MKSSALKQKARTVIDADGDNRAAKDLNPKGDNPNRPFGLCAGEFVVSDDFDDPLPDDVLDAFEGR